jgi:hypothetical protein
MDAAPWGFDLCNLLYEAIYFSLKGKNSLQSVDEASFLGLHRIIISLLVKRDTFTLTLETLQQYILDNNNYWGNIADKLPVLKFTDIQKKYIKQLESLAFKNI